MADEMTVVSRKHATDRVHFRCARCGVELTAIRERRRKTFYCSLRCYRNGPHAAITHGLTHASEHAIWCSMKSRCGNPNATQYAWYGGRGIRVCEAWVNSFETFLADVGRRPSLDHSIDRINGDGNYEPGNVRWATRLEQAQNKSNNRVLVHDGKSLTIAEWGRRLGLRQGLISDRLIGGKSVADALAPITRRQSWMK